MLYISNRAEMKGGCDIYQINNYIEAKNASPLSHLCHDNTQYIRN